MGESVLQALLSAWTELGLRPGQLPPPASPGRRFLCMTAQEQPDRLLPQNPETDLRWPTPRPRAPSQVRFPRGCSPEQPTGGVSDSFGNMKTPLFSLSFEHEIEPVFRGAGAPRCMQKASWDCGRAAFTPSGHAVTGGAEVADVHSARTDEMCLRHSLC